MSCSSKKQTSGGVTIDSVAFLKGKVIFAQECSSCHNFKQDAIGPALGGISAEVSQQWLAAFIRNPDSKRWDSRDGHAKMLFKKYQTSMPSFPQLSDVDIQNVITFISQHPKVTAVADTTWPEPVADPIPEKIERSEAVVAISKIATIPPSSDKKPLARITQLLTLPGSSDLFVLDLRGKLYRVSQGKAAVYFDLAKTRPDFINQPGLATGFGSFAFHPAFNENGLLYTSHTETPRKAGASRRPDFDFADSINATVQYVITEWKAKDPRAFEFSGESRELFRISMVTGIHGIQEIAFNPTAKKGTDDFGALYICIGDGGAVENGYGLLAHNVRQPWGTILRIDPSKRNSRNKNYGIPPTNPFANDKDNAVLKEIYAFGFRNPHRVSWTKTGKMVVVNVGNSHIESVDVVGSGDDFGWPLREGKYQINPAGNLSNLYPLPGDDAKHHFKYPAAMYDHQEGRAITGGFEYVGKRVRAFQGKYVFGDILTGRLFYFNVKELDAGAAELYEWRISLKGKIISLKDLTGPERVDLHFGRDNDGELYMMTKADGNIYSLSDQ